mmetsp:Transcript_25814/g.65083  ORF Transcript_25814/g.65083 Transcript_25814/m.65083 type:complete len:211 (-) Transcript_25814:536-1168(-)
MLWPPQIRWMLWPRRRSGVRHLSTTRASTQRYAATRLRKIPIRTPVAPRIRPWPQMKHHNCLVSAARSGSGFHRLGLAAAGAGVSEDHRDWCPFPIHRRAAPAAAIHDPRAPCWWLAWTSAPPRPRQRHSPPVPGTGWNSCSTPRPRPPGGPWSVGLGSGRCRSTSSTDSLHLGSSHSAPPAARAPCFLVAIALPVKSQLLEFRLLSLFP